MLRPGKGQGTTINAELILPAKPISDGRHPSLARDSTQQGLGDMEERRIVNGTTMGQHGKAV